MRWINRTRLKLAIYYLQKATQEIQQVVDVPFVDDEDVWYECSHTPRLADILDLSDCIEAIKELAEQMSNEG